MEADYLGDVHHVTARQRVWKLDEMPRGTISATPRHTKSTNEETISLPTRPSLDLKREEDTSTIDPTIASDPDTSCDLEELTATLGIQMRRVEEARTEAKITIVDKTVLMP